MTTEIQGDIVFVKEGEKYISSFHQDQQEAFEQATGIIVEHCNQ